MKKKVEKYLYSKNIDGVHRLKDNNDRYLIGDDIDGCLRAVRDATAAGFKSNYEEDGMAATKVRAKTSFRVTAHRQSDHNINLQSRQRPLLPRRKRKAEDDIIGDNEDEASMAPRPAQNHTVAYHSGSLHLAPKTVGNLYLYKLNDDNTIGDRSC